MSDNRPRRLFGLLCAHHWEVIAEGVHERVFVSGATSNRPFRELRCKHCGDLRTRYVGVQP